MGGGSYSYNDAVTRSRSYKSQSIEKTFSKKNLDPEMNPLNINFRESCDSEEHPESFPIIIALDETGSMGKVPKYLIDNTLPDCVASIMKAGIDNPQICFMAFGDVEDCYEEAPLQVGQFESSDELMEKWLRKVDLEGKGGGNGGEDPHMCWYFAANHIKTDALEKRGIKGCLITISDEPIP